MSIYRSLVPLYNRSEMVSLQEVRNVSTSMNWIYYIFQFLMILEWLYKYWWIKSKICKLRQEKILSQYLSCWLAVSCSFIGRHLTTTFTASAAAAALLLFIFPSAPWTIPEEEKRLREEENIRSENGVKKERNEQKKRDNEREIKGKKYYGKKSSHVKNY